MRGLDLYRSYDTADNPHMSYRHLPLTCECGEVPARILEVGFTAQHELVIHYWCSACRRVVCVSKPFTECWRECPQPGFPQGAPGTAGPTKPVDPTAEDARFLQSIGVTFNDQVDSR
jgi:hypothetical protein